MKLIYQVNDRPKPAKLMVFALQQLLAIMTATLVVPIIVNGDILNNFPDTDKLMSPGAALFGAGAEDQAA